MNNMIRDSIRFSALAAMMLFSATVFAQEVPAEAQPVPAEAQAQAEPQPAAAEDNTAPSNDPGDIITNYFNAMGDIVAQNMDSPAELIKQFSAYIKDNEKSMKATSKAFEAKMNSLKPNEAEEYREKVQRKITPALNKLISLLLSFEEKYPKEAAELDSILKVDAKYTYQQ